MLYRCVGFLFPDLALVRILSDELFVIVILQEGSDKQRSFHNHGLVLPASGDHILPDQHPETVTVIVPAKRFNLDVLSQRIEAQLLHHADVIDEFAVV